MDGEIKMVEVEKIEVPYEYRQQPHQRFVDLLAAQFDPKLCGELIVNERPNGRLVVFDGQHRLLAAQQAKVKQVRARVYHWSEEEEIRRWGR